MMMMMMDDGGGVGYAGLLLRLLLLSVKWMRLF